MKFVVIHLQNGQTFEGWMGTVSYAAPHNTGYVDLYRTPKMANGLVAMIPPAFIAAIYFPTTNGGFTEQP